MEEINEGFGLLLTITPDDKLSPFTYFKDRS